MKKIYLTFVALLLLVPLYGQDVSCASLDSTATFEQQIACIFAGVDRSAGRIPSRVLLENGYNLSNVELWNGVRSLQNQGDLQTLLIHYASLRSAYLGGLNLMDIDRDDILSGNLQTPIIHLPTLEKLENAVFRADPAGAMRIPMVLIRYHSIREDAEALGWMRVQDNQVFDTPNGLQNNPFVLRTAFVAATQDTIISGNQHTFMVSPTSFASNLPLQSIRRLEVDFDNGEGYRTLPWQTRVSVTWGTDTYQRKEIRFRVRLITGEIYEGHSYLYINGDRRPSVSRYFNAPDDVISIARTSIHDGARLEISYADVNKSTRRITKPFIVFEGFDLDNSNGYADLMADFDVIFDGASFNEHLSSVWGGGYDLIHVNYNNGTDDIRHNAHLCHDVIRWVNAQKALSGSNEQNVVMGISMGGLVARYGLAQMVRAGEETQVRLLITHDSPHRGANAPLGMQAAARMLQQDPMTQALFGRYLNEYDSPAASQMLLTKVSTRWVLGQGFALEYNSWLDADYRPMVNIQTPYRIIATSQGSECAISPIPNGHQILKIDASLSFPRRIFLFRPGVNFDMQIKTYQGNARHEVYHQKLSVEFKLFALRVRIPVLWNRYMSPSNYPKYDIMPGGTYTLPTISFTFPDPNNNSFLHNLIRFTGMVQARGSLDVRFGFIPVASALDIETFNDNTAFARYSGGISDQVRRMDNFITQERITWDGVVTDNVRHTDFTPRQSEWIFREMEQQQNQINCAVNCLSNTLAFSATAEKDCSTVTFTLNQVPPGAVVTWTAPEGVTPSSGIGPVATVSVSEARSVWIDYRIGNCQYPYTTTPVYVGAPPAPNQFTWFNGKGGLSASPSPVIYVSNWSYTYIDVLAATPALGEDVVDGYIWELDGDVVPGNEASNVLAFSPGDEGEGYIRISTYNACGVSEPYVWNFQTVICQNPTGDCTGGSMGSWARSVSSYPNPADNTLQLDNQSEQQVSVRLIDQLGNTVQEQIVNQRARYDMDTRHLPAGIYYLLTSHQGEIKKEIVVVKH